MDREDRALAYVGLSTATVLGFLSTIFTINPNILGSYAQFVIWIFILTMCLILFGLGLLFFKNREKPIPQAIIFSNVSVFFTDNKFKDEDYFLYNPKYVANTNTKKIYFMPNNFIDRYLRNQYITTHKAYSREKELKDDLLKRGYEFIPTDATLRNLDIFSFQDKLMPFRDIDEKSLTTLKLGCAKEDLKNYKLIFVHKWRHRTRKTESENFPPSNRLILDCDTDVVRQPPNGDLWLYADGIIGYEIHRKHFPYEKIRWWAFFEFDHLRFERSPCPLSELINKCKTKEVLWP